MLMLSVPATLGLMVLARPIIELLFQYGKFDATSTRFVAGALLFYAPGILGYSVVKIVSPSFYSLQDARTPVLVSLLTIAANLALNIWLNSIMGFRGLALGTALAANINAGLLLYLLSRRIEGVDARRLLIAFGKIGLASLLMAAAAYWTESWLHVLLTGNRLLDRLIRVSGGIGAGIVALALAAWMLHIHEFRQAIGRVMAKIR